MAVDGEVDRDPGSWYDDKSESYGGDDSTTVGSEWSRSAAENNDQVVKRSRFNVSMSFGVEDATNTIKIKQRILMLLNRIKTSQATDHRYIKFFAVDGKEIEPTALPDGEALKKMFNLAQRQNRRFKTNVEGFLTIETTARRLWTIKMRLWTF